ncbi:helix-turn-helix transcriptional regulator [Arthrobacter sp. STN4]|uniref:helix-turn-helix transcriptional regulator n=1 Tax=Arthrobacter sp. STN4 TaxID=2923276 RepID=UPI00211A50D6|nr:helix-turn-helix transcriptional regulator [Arthrobacter sp. STN4]MCQ9163607.1 helix-turn-helix domain-containing protein [Arthrobacter sp. STN4]
MSSHVPGRIVALRTQARMSQRQLAAASGVPQSTLSRIESASRQAQLGEIALIAQALGRSLGSILDECPLEDRVLVATRANKPSADAESVKDRLVYFLEMDEFLDHQGIPAR